MPKHKPSSYADAITYIEQLEEEVDELHNKISHLYVSRDRVASDAEQEITLLKGTIAKLHNFAQTKEGYGAVQAALQAKGIKLED